jgi:serine/threonine protein kinase
MPPPLQPDTILQGKYRVLAIAGGGGMALVYKIEEIHPPGQIWALKELRAASGSPEERADARRQFGQEAKMLARLDHSNLPKVVDYFDEPNRSFLVMEFIEGHSLERHLEAAGRGLPEKPVLHWMIQVCQVLGYLHQQKPPIIFRDLKPSNIMLSNTGVIKLIDFGIARTYKVGKKKDTTTMGSENYAPPEQWGKGQTDARSDIYALGATMYHLLTGTPPLPCFVPQQLPSPCSLNSAISPSIEQVVLTGMAKARQDRYQTAEEMEIALSSCLTELRAVQPVMPEPVITGRPCPSCGCSNRPEAHFCGHCGTHLSGQLRGMLQIIGLAGPAWEMAVAKSPFFIGRKSPSDGIYPDLDLSHYDARFVSRLHAQITQSGSEYVLIDLGSANGTFVNGVQLPPHAPRVLRSGDRVTIGKAHLVFRLAV